MKSLKSRDWKKVYRTGQDDLLNDFYLPALKSAVRYDRAVGYFSSELLVVASQGLSNLIKAGGKMRLIIGDPLDEDEYLAVKEGRDLCWAYEDLETKILSLIEGEHGSVAKYRLQLLTWMLACGLLEIKFAFRKKGMYHEKIGVVTDENGERLVFTGSMNETVYALDSTKNAESLSVYSSWNEEVFNDYGKPFELAFEVLWSGSQKDTLTFEVPSNFYENIAQKANISECPGLEEKSEVNSLVEKSKFLSYGSSEPYVPEMLGGRPFKIKEHQQQALMKWKADGYIGILQLATGSGKTITSIYGAVVLYQAFGRLVFIVAVPYDELAVQWVENLKTFGISPHKCFGGKGKWFDRFKLDAQAFASGKKKFLAAVVINKTMQTSSFQEVVDMLPSRDLMFVGDECHRHGAEATYKALPNAGMRMGLSATPFRSEDDEVESPFPDDARKRLLEYYGRVVEIYSLSDAINDDVLTPYKYHVCPVRLSEEEQEEYEELSRKIGNLILAGEKATSDSETLTLLCGKRSRLLGGAENKLLVLDKKLNEIPEEEKKHVLFYCAEGSSETSKGYSKNVDLVSSILNKKGWRSSQFTANEGTMERKRILKSFLLGGIDALVSMKVLDEGVDIPACRTAFILASTKNPRQYVQRRGRILRKFEKKDYAVIYDFVILPAEGWEETSAAKNLIRSEKERINDFALLAKNKRDIHEELEGLGIEL